jgi:tetratricopeptide (TPR) repeat protein
MVALLIASQLACSTRQHAAQPTNRPAHSPDVRQSKSASQATTLPRIVVTPLEVRDIEELYEQARLVLAAGQPVEAARLFDQVHRLDPQGPLAPEALYHSAAAHEKKGNLAASVWRLEQLVSRFGSHQLARVALTRAVWLRAQLDDWQRAGELAELLLARFGDLGPLQRVIAHSGVALQLVELGEVERALWHVEKGRTVVEDHRLDAAGRLPRELAPLYYALGEVRRVRASQIRFVPLPDNFAVTLEQRCQLLLDAQSAYSDAMRAYDPHWSGMAGYRVGELYQTLHRDLMRIEPPPSADTAQLARLFRGAMRLRYSILLDKALAMVDHTLAMAERSGERSGWVLRAEQAKRAIEAARRAEHEAIERLPYTRAELKSALDQLARRHVGAAEGKDR